MTREEQILKVGEEIASNPFELEGFIEGAVWADEHPQNFWHDAQGDILPDIDKEVIVLCDDGHGGYKVCFAHRPVESYTGISIHNHSEMEEYYPERYDKGGWNIPGVMWWLNVDLPIIEEEQQ